MYGGRFWSVCLLYVDCLQHLASPILLPFIRLNARQKSFADFLEHGHLAVFSQTVIGTGLCPPRTWPSKNRPHRQQIYWRVVPTHQSGTISSREGGGGRRETCSWRNPRGHLSTKPTSWKFPFVDVWTTPVQGNLSWYHIFFAGGPTHKLARN